MACLPVRIDSTGAEGDTCLAAEEAMTLWNIVAFVACGDGAALLLPAERVAQLPSKLSRLDQLSKAKLGE